MYNRSIRVNNKKFTLDTDKFMFNIFLLTAITTNIILYNSNDNAKLIYKTFIAIPFKWLSNHGM